MACEQLTGTFPIDDPSVLKASVSALTFRELPALAEVALEYYDGATDAWAEPADARFLVNADDDDDTDVAKVHDIGGVQMIPWLLNKALVEMPADPTTLLANGTRPYNSATPGAILKTIIDEAQALGWAPYITYDFDADDDSAGEPWAVEVDISYRPGTKALVVLRNLLAQGLVEFRTEGRVIRLFNAGTGTDHTVEPAPGVDFAPVRVGRSATATPIRRSIDDLLTDAILFGDDGYVHEVNNPGAVTGLGALREAIQQGGVSDDGTAELLVQAQLEQGAQVREQYRTTENSAVAASLPWVTGGYKVGDWVQAWLRAEWERVRVFELVVDKKLDGTVSVSPVLNDRFLDALARLAKRTVGIVGGAVAGGTGATPSTPGDDNRLPKAPTDLIVSSTGYWSNNTALAQVSAGWAAVTEGADSVAIEVDHYELWARLDGGADESDEQTSSATTTATWSPYNPGEVWLFKVRAVSANGFPGPFSDEESVTMLEPVDQVDTPTLPQLSTSNGVLIVAWDGLIDTTPPTPPSQFRQVNIEYSATEHGTYTRVGTLFIDNQRAVIAGLGVGSIPWVRFVAVDSLGRESDPTAGVSITITGIAGADIVAHSIEVNSLKAGSITVDYLASSVGGQLTLAGNPSIVLIGGQLADLTADQADTAEDLADLRLYVQIDGTEVKITRPGSDLSFAVSNSQAAMRQSGVDVSKWTAGQFQVPNLLATVAQLANHIWSADPAGTGSMVKKV